MLNWMTGYRIVLAAALSMFACFGRAAEPLKIGMVAPLTGAAAEIGRIETDGAKLAAEEVNKAGGVLGRPIELVTEDDQATNPGVVLAFSKLAGDKDIPAFVGPILSTQIHAMVPDIQRLGKPVMIGGTDPQLTHMGNPWLPELGQITPSDPLFAGYPVSPKRISGLINVSTQLLKQQTGPELDRILISDISRQLGSYLDQVALYGGGNSANQPTGLINVSGVAQGVAIDPANRHASFCALEEQIENADVDMSNYGVLMSPATKKILRTAPSFTGGSITTWSELTNPQSSPEITDGKCFAGCWHCLTFAIWGRGVEVLVDPFTLSQSNQTRLIASLFCDVGVRYPAAFAVTVAVT